MATRNKPKRKAKPRRRRPRQPTFRAGRDSYQTALAGAYQQETKKHASLLKVVEVTIGTDAWLLRGPDLLAYFGFGDYSLHYFDSSDADYSKQHSMPEDGGHTSVVKDTQGNFATLVFMRNRKQAEPELIAGINLALFYHEIGHVEDFEKAVNLVIGRPVDTVQMELYAHRFACLKLMRGDFRHLLAFYLGNVVADLSKSNTESVRRAAQLFNDSDDYKICERFAGNYMDAWRE